ncbi:MAG: CDP-alcohol phosphatidyltransferase family protein [Candidatus Latescibacterota bacterium]
MIQDGLLVFEEDADGASPTARRVAGLPLLDRAIRTLARAGVERLTVITPAGAPLPVTRFSRRLGVDLRFTTWDAAGPGSVHPGGDVLVLLGDHVHHHASLAGLVRQGLGSAALAVHTSPAPPQEGPHRTVQAGSSGFGTAWRQGPASEEAISTGAFLCSGGILARADLSAGRGDFTAALASWTRPEPVVLRQQPTPLWRLARTRPQARAAKRMLFSLVTKSTSGFISRHLNARLSIPTSMLLVETGISPHWVTVLLVLTTGLAAAVLVSQPQEYLRLALAGTLWQLAAVFDRCDGEIARVRLSESRFGAWFDTVTDNLAYVCGYVGLVAGMRVLHPGTALHTALGISAVASMLLFLTVMYAYARSTGTGSLQDYLRDLTVNLPDADKGRVQAYMQRLGFVAKRDFFSFVVFVAAVLNQIEVAFWFLVSVLHLAAAAVMLSQRRMLQQANGRRVRATTPQDAARPCAAQESQ